MNMFSSIKKINCTKKHKISKKLMQEQSWSFIYYHLKIFYKRDTSAAWSESGQILL